MNIDSGMYNVSDNIIDGKAYYMDRNTSKHRKNDKTLIDFLKSQKRVKIDVNCDIITSEDLDQVISNLRVNFFTDHTYNFSTFEETIHHNAIN